MKIEIQMFYGKTLLRRNSMTNLDNNIANMNYQKWKDTIIHLILYNYFK